MQHRFKLLAAALLLLPIIQACGDDIPPPPPTGSIDGLVSIEGQGIDGVSVTLSNGGSATTANGGMYRFDDVEAGAYTVTISNYPDEASFDHTSAPATIATDGETVTVNFPGTYIRTSSIMGSVTVENDGLGGITVKLSGVSDSETLTDASGQYAFTGLRAGNYTIEITGFDDEDVAFSSTSSAATLAVGESKVVSFEGTYLRSSGIVGQVTADEEPQEGITVSMQGRGESRSTTTNSSGQFAFEQLRRGDYSVVISNYDTDEVSFDETSQTVTVAYGETANVPFEGTLLRTAGIEGTVTVEDAGPLAGVTVSIQGQGESESRVTDNMGAYAFTRLHAGEYSVVISGFDDDEYGFPDGTSATVTVELQETGTVPFEGIMLRTAAIEGTVTVGDDDAPLPGVTVTVSGGPKDEEHETTTNGDGEYAVENLHAGAYSVSISGYDTREYGFNPTTESVDVGLRETADVAFQGDLLRTAGVSGRVHVNGMGLAGVTVELSGEESREGTTDADGQYGFSGLAAGDYTVTISGWDEVEYHFNPTMDFSLELDESKTGVNFAGRPLRTATVMGSVTVEEAPLAGIAVTLIRVVSANAGEVMGVMATGADGGYSFGPLLAGSYQVTIAGYADEHDFAAGTTQTTMVDTDGTAEVNFAATIIRTAGVSGMVTVDGEAMAGVEVTLSGEHAPDDNTMMTGDDGMYGFGDLRKGDYTVSIANPDAEVFSFPSTSQGVNLSVGQEQGGVNFAGTRLSTASVSGRVHVNGTGLEGVTVTLSGEESRAETTDADGQYGFSALAAGDYTLTISGWDDVEYAFDATMDVTLGQGEAKLGANFEGKPLRTATVMGSVTVEEAPLAGVAVTLIKVVSANSGEILGASATDDEGGYSFGPLLAGAYQVMIAGYDDEHDFGEAGTTRTTSVDTDGTAEVNFAATIIRTAGVSGMVTVDGDAMAGVEVTLTGEHAPDDNTMMTGDDGMYGFGDLRKGDYTVSIANPDEESYSFPSTSQDVNLSVGQEQDGVNFAGAQLKQASISGQVHAEGDPVEGVMVTLSGDADGEDMTDANGEYNFPALAGGDYTVTIAGWDEAAYIFDNAEAEVEDLGTDEFKIVDFEGVHTRTASIGGMLFLDEVTKNLMHNEGEPTLDLDDVLPMGVPGLPITLLGPELGDSELGFASRTGMYSFDDLRAGAYVVSVDVEMEVPLPSGDTATVEGILAMLGYEYTGPSLIQVGVAAAEESMDNNLPFKITMQTINVEAVMGTPGPDGASETVVAGVKLELYATTEANAPKLGASATTDSAGVATFHFPRAMDLGPGGQGTDHLVFAKVTSTGHDDLVVSDNADIEIEYAATDRVSDADAAVRLLNNRANFQWWIKSDADAKDGNEFLAGWKVVLGTDTIATGADGKGSYSGTVALGDESATMTVMAHTTQADSLTMGEEWKQSAALEYTHNPLALPAMNTAEMNDLGPIYVTFTTQRLVLGVYREADDEEGYTDYRSLLPRGDHRPHPTTAGEMAIELLARDTRDRLRRYEWDPDDDGEYQKEGYKKVGSNGMVTFTGIPAGAELTVRFHVGSSARKQVDYGYDEIETFGDDLDFGVTRGAFGEMAGGGPEVRMCSASDDTNADAIKDEWCATFGYVWKTGGLSGTVGTQAGHEVVVEPETGHGATGDDTKTRTGGAYGFTGLQDGEYSATASNNGDYTVNGTATEEGIAVYHDEYADNKDEDKADSAWAGRRAQATKSWTTTRGGLAIMGYVANDADGNNLVRGDEGMAGVEVKLLTDVKFVRTGVNAGKLSSSKTAATTETANNGLYSFSGLNNVTDYWVQVVAGDAAGGYRSLTATNPNLSAKLAADVYPALPEESSYAKPAWNRATGSATGTTVVITDDQGTTSTADDVSATLQNFGLVYTNGTVAGEVNNVSGSNGNIDVRITSSLDEDALWERATSRAGEFSVANVMEGPYTAVIEDAGFLAPCMSDTTSTGGPAGKPDDDGPTRDVNGVDTCYSAATSLTGTVEGRSDYQSIGTLHIYSATASANDTLGDGVSVKAKIQGTDATTYNDTTTWDPSTGWTRAAGESTTENTTSLGTISWASKTVTVTFGARNAAIPDDGSVSLKVGTKACSGTTCTLEANETGGAGIGTPMVNTITVTVTAENGYNDHEYTMVAARADPIGNTLAATNITRADSTDHAADGTGDAFTFTTTGASSVKIVFGLTVLGVAGEDNAYCAQRVSVKPTGGNALDATEDDDDDVCPDTRYTLSASASPGTSYDVIVRSEDGKSKTYNLRVIKGS